MVFNCSFYVFGVTIADFDAVSVEDFVEPIMLRKMLIKQILKIFVTFSEYIFTKTGIKPNHISFVATFVVHFCNNFCCSLSLRKGGTSLNISSLEESWERRFSIVLGMCLIIFEV